jgi:hypothetical protein
MVTAVTENQVHQLLHGYRSGHGQLAASIKLPDRDADLTTRLSDLSGSLSSGLQLAESYLTVYPLPSRTFFAIARTWPDPEAGRAGCVLTHTLLIPTAAWSTLVDVHSVNQLFRNPRLNPEYSFAEVLRLPVGCIVLPTKDIEIDVAASRAFVSRYFGRGLRPIVWFNAAAPEEYLWRLLEHLWPKLRCAFSSCTFSLQQRNLQDGPFDLLFAPSSVYSRFAKLAPEHVLDPALERKVEPATEPWCQYWAEALFSSQPGLPSRETELPIWNELGEDPTAVRKLSLVHELRLRAPQSPMAGVGAIDAVESLAHDPDAALVLKRLVLNDAIEASASARAPEDALRSLRLIDDRLHRESFANIAADFEKRLDSAAEQVTMRHPEAAIEASGLWLAESTADGKGPFARGVVGGLRRLAKTEPSRLQVLRSHADIAAELFRLEPTFAGAYLQLGSEPAPRVVANWLLSTQDSEALRLARKTILPLLPPQKNEELLSALLREIPEKEVKETLTILAESSNGFSNQAVRNVVIDRIAQPYPDLVKQWAPEARWSRGVAAIVASAYQPNRQGFIDLLERSRITGERLAEVLAKLISNQTGSSYWLRELMSRDVRLIRTLLLVGRDMSADIEASIARLLREAPDAPVAEPDLLEVVTSLEGRSIFPQLLEAAARGVVTKFIKDEMPSADAKDFFQTPQALHWLQSVPASQLTALVGQGCSAHHAVARTWKWISEAPRALYDREPPVLVELLDALLLYTKRSFTEGLEDSLVRVLQRSRSEASPEVRQVLCAKLLRLAFDNTSLPMGRVVAEVFADVYAVAIKKDVKPPSFWSALFGTYDWDKGKDLRVSLIDVFLRSRWAAGDLAVAGNRAGLLRKIFKRLHRRTKGDEYISRMQRDLSQRTDKTALQARESLKPLIADPDFYEEWD